MNFSIALGCKIPQQFDFLILHQIFWNMLLPFVTAIDFVVLSQFSMNNVSSCVMSLFTLRYTKYVASSINVNVNHPLTLGDSHYPLPFPADIQLQNHVVYN